MNAALARRKSRVQIPPGPHSCFRITLVYLLQVRFHLRGKKLTRFASLKDEFSFVRGNVLVLAVTLIIVNFMSAIPFTFYPKYVEELGGTPFIVGVIGFASFLILALVQFPGGYLADKHGRRWLTVAMTFGVAVTSFLYAVAPS